MINVILVIHLLLAIAMVAVIMLQRSEGGALGIGGGGGGLMTGRAAGNLLTRTTAILATAFMVTSLGLAVLANNREAPASILDQPMPLVPAPTAPDAAPAAPATPAPPLAR